MTDKVLPGSSREALSFIAVHWKSLLKMSLLPFAAYIVVAVLQIRSMSSFYRSFGSLTAGNGINPTFMGSYMQGMALSMLGSLVAMCLFGLLFAQIVRFHKTGVAEWLMTDKASISAGMMTLVYSIGIVMLTLLAYIVGVIAVAIVAVIVGLILSLIFTGNTAAGVLSVLLGAASLVVFIGGLYWFMFRLFVGLPGVALGSSPDFFRDMWPLSKGESWGLPMRMLLATVIAYVPILLVLSFFIGPAWFEMVGQMSQAQNADNPQVMFPLMADMMEQMMPATLVMALVYMPFMWFSALLLAIAFQRFRARG
jgi:hypothetical protein